MGKSITIWRACSLTYVFFCTSELLERYGVRVNIIGRVEMLPEDVQEAVRHAENMTRQNTK